MLCASAAEAAATGLSIRAGGTDAQALIRIGRAAGPWADLRDAGGGLREVSREPGGRLRLGALVTVCELAGHPAVHATAPALASSAADLATPQIRAVATLGGSLLQATRCPYFRHLGADCARTGGRGCPARAAEWREGVAVDLGGCAAPHPSTLAAALMAHDASVELHDGTCMVVDDLLGDGSEVGEHRLPPGQVLVAVHLDPPWNGERGGYARASSRRLAEWPYAEAVVRFASDESRITRAALVVGGIAARPLRLPEVAEALVGQSLDDISAPEVIDVARGPLVPAAAWKLRLVRPLVADAIAKALPAAWPRSPEERRTS